ncbi:hypothetical protein F4802DRAFT_572767 [Xylaria palmicola]|nr:hypothetical protein F4802DRAFT_572767 [Xylaria palmicola]
MADYASLKVPELKKLLQEKLLPVTGNKADLIVRLQEHDKAQEAAKPAAEPAGAPVSAEEDPIDYSDDDVPASKPEPAAKPALVEEKPAEPAAAPAEPAAEAPAPSSEDQPAEAATGDANPVESEAEAVPKTDFSAHLPASSADEEARKRAERAKRFGITENVDEEAKKKAERAQRFGADQTSVPSGLDTALPEKRERKRGREGAPNPNGNADGERGAKRQQSGPGRRRGGRDNRGRGGRHGGGDRAPPRKEGGGGGGGKPRGVLDDPSERAKADARAKRFGA